MAEPITAAAIGAVLTVVVQATELGQEVISWFYEPEEMCNTKVNDDPEQWGMRPCLDVIEVRSDNPQTTSD